MQRVIYKYPVHSGTCIKVLPEGFKILKVDVQGDHGQVWVEQPAKVGDTKEVAIRIFGTGQAFDDEGLVFINTFFQGPFVWHVYYEVL